jgi:hypothetical protein
MKVNTKKVKEVAEYLKWCKEVYLGDGNREELKEMGVTEKEDLLSGIYQEGRNCYVSYLFDQLNSEEKKAVQSKLDFEVDFEALSAVYQIN